MEFDNSVNAKAFWTYDATIMLINKYKSYKNKFADSIHKNTEVRDMIDQEFWVDGFTFCGSQCENRWKHDTWRRKIIQAQVVLEVSEFFKFKV